MGDIGNVKENYSIKEWRDRESYYKTELRKLVVPPQLTYPEVIKLTSEIDALLTEALIDYAYIESLHSDFESRMKKAKEELYVRIKKEAQQSLNDQGINKAITADEVKSYIIDYLNTHPLDGDKGNIFKLESITAYRVSFIKRMVETLKEKKASLLTDTAILKIEAGIKQP